MQSKPGEAVGKRDAAAPLVVFFVLLVIFSGGFNALIVATGSPNLILGLMWSVGLAAILALKLCGRPLSELGWAWGSARYHLIAIALPLTYATLAYGIAAIAGLVAILEPARIDVLVQASGFAFLPAPLGLVTALGVLVTVGMIQIHVVVAR